MEDQRWYSLELDPVLVQQGLLSLEELDMSSDVLVASLKGTKKRKRSNSGKHVEPTPPKKPKAITGSVLAPKSKGGDAPKNEMKNEEEQRNECPAESKDMSAWLKYRLHPLLLKGLQECGFCEPTPIQSQALPAALKGRKDIFGAAETGSGKTLAYSLPILHKLLQESEKKSKWESPSQEAGSGIKALVITPTRELAIQVADHMKKVSRHTHLRIATIIGGLAPQKQRRVLSRQPQILIATPGRLWELLNEVGSYLRDLSGLQFIVIDEADRLIEGGHFPEVKSIFGIINASPSSLEEEVHEDENEEANATANEENLVENASQDSDDSDVAPSGKQKKKKKKKPSPEPTQNKPAPPTTERQTFIFSATLTVPVAARDNAKRAKQQAGKKKTTLDHLKKLVASGRQKVIIDLTTQQIVARALQETQIHCLTEEKDYYLYYFCARQEGRSLVFVNSIDCIRRLKPLMELLGLPAWGLHAELQQKQRLKNLERFKSTRNCLLIATDVAARGLDIEGVDHVIHYQLPRTTELYVHRSGRTARGSASGKSVMLVGPEDKICYSKICRVLREGKDIEGYEIEKEYMPQVAKRVNLARKLDKLLHAERKKKTERDWIISNAKAMELAVDDDLLSSDDEEAKQKRNDQQRQSQVLQAQLNTLLKQPLLPKGVSTRYFTKSPVLPSLLSTLGKIPTGVGKLTTNKPQQKKTSKHLKGRKKANKGKRSRRR